MSISDGPIVYFDGVCNLCNSVVQFIIRNDRDGVFRFASLQSKLGEEARASAFAEKASADDRDADSVILFYKGRYYAKSEAVLKVARLLGGWMLLLIPGYILPRFIRDAIYDAVAKRRYKWFGRKEECMIPTPELKARFLDE